jgi:Fe-Mn family superoxide dismutase
MEHTLPTLPFAPDALVPYMSEETLRFHHGKHHQAYIDNLNKLVKGTAFESLELKEIIRQAPQGPIYNNAAQVWNHSFFWNCLQPAGNGTPKGPLLLAICAKWGSVAGFNEAFRTAAIGNFGSGWTWLVQRKDGAVDVINTGAAGNPLVDGETPLLCIDVWEHAYYVDYRNQRPAFVDAFLSHLVKWRFAESNFRS